MLTLLFLQSATEAEIKKNSKEMFEGLWRFWITEWGFLWIVIPIAAFIVVAIIVGAILYFRSEKQWRRNHTYYEFLQREQERKR